MINELLLRQGLQKLLKQVDSAIRERFSDEPALEAKLRERHAAAVRAERTEGTAKGYNAFADEAITQAAAHWLLGCVFVRFLEDNGWLDERNAKVAWVAGSSDLQVRALAERLLERFAVTVGDLPASAAHHHADPGGLYRHSAEVALKALEEFEGNMAMERRPDGSVDSFRSAHNRSRWQYATFIAALCHDLGKLFDLEVRAKGRTWCPLHEPYDAFGRRTKTPVASWRPDRKYGAHAWSSLALLHHVVSCEDVAFLGAPRLWHLFASLAEGHSKEPESPLSQTVSRADQASVEQAQPAIAARPDSKASLLLQAFHELITAGEMGVNVPGGQVYVEGGKAAVVVPVSIDLARDRLRGREIKLPSNNDLYDILRNARLVDADETGRSVRKIKVQGRQGNLVPLSALIFSSADKVVPKLLLADLERTHFEIDTEPVPATPVAEAQAPGEKT